MVDVGPGSVLFVPALEEHRFLDITEDLALELFGAEVRVAGTLRLPPRAATLAASSMPRRASALARSLPGSPRAPLHPHPADVVRAHRLDEPAPQVVVLDRSRPRLPAVALHLHRLGGVPFSRYVLSVCRLTLAAAAAPRAPGWPPSAPSGCSWSAGRSRTSPFPCPATGAPRPTRPAPCTLAARAVCVDHDLGHAGRLRPAAPRYRHPACDAATILRRTPEVHTVKEHRRGVEQFGSSLGS